MSKKETPALHLTGDGSHTLYSSRFQQHYHNPNGAVAESLHVFFEQNGLINHLQSGQPVSILEVGFGTGLNLLLLLDICEKAGLSAPIHYYTIEAYPINRDEAARLNHASFLHNPHLADRLPDIFENLVQGGNRFSLLENVSLEVFIGKFTEYSGPDTPAGFIFHDPFSPDVNPGLWEAAVFEKLRSWCRPDAILSTYCAASKARGAMAYAGWLVARAAGALGKREMTLASPNADRLEGFKRVNEQRLARRYEEGDF